MTACIVVLGLLNAGLIALLKHLVTEHAKERRLLNACIQRPETAVAAANRDLPDESYDTAPYVPFDDDEAFHEAVKG